MTLPAAVTALSHSQLHALSSLQPALVHFSKASKSGSTEWPGRPLLRCCLPPLRLSSLLFRPHPFAGLCLPTWAMHGRCFVRLVHPPPVPSWGPAASVPAHQRQGLAPRPLALRHALRAQVP